VEPPEPKNRERGGLTTAKNRIPKPYLNTDNSQASIFKANENSEPNFTETK